MWAKTKQVVCVCVCICMFLNVFNMEISGHHLVSGDHRIWLPLL